jgi:circadian clock protein KaiC
MRSINIDFAQHVKSGLLKFSASRPTLHGLEMHLVVIYKLIRQFKPKVVILDPITNLVTVGDPGEVKSILIRLIDFLQNEQITVMFTALTLNGNHQSQIDEDVSSVVDTWISLRDIEYNGERNHTLYILKSRGMKNSNQVREFLISNEGIQIGEVALGPKGVLIGSAKKAYELEKATNEAIREQKLKRKNKEIEIKKAILEEKILSLRAEFELAKNELNSIDTERELRREITEKNREAIVRMRENKPEKTTKKKK